MTYSIDTRDRRRSQRISHSLPLYVRCPDFACTFAGNLTTVVVSHHGCMLQAPRPIPKQVETPICLHHKLGLECTDYDRLTSTYHCLECGQL